MLLKNLALWTFTFTKGKFGLDEKTKGFIIALMITKDSAKAVIKSINRQVNKMEYFKGGKQFGVDFATWSVTCPQMAQMFSEAAKVLTGREGRFLPRFK